ncbi:MAG: APC family permease [Thermoplasmatales archaeon]
MSDTEEINFEELAHETDKSMIKNLHFWDLVFISLGVIIGSGWLFSVDAGAYIAGPAVIVSWIIAGILTLFIAFTYAELGGMFPRAGGVIRYSNYSHGQLVSFIQGWIYVLSFIVTPPLEAEATATYASVYIPGLFKTVSGVTVFTSKGFLLGAILMIIFFFLNYAGVKVLRYFNRYFVLWKILIPSLTFIFLFFAFRSGNFISYGGFAPLGADKIFTAIPLAGIMFSYLGFRQVTDWGSEMKNPKRDLPRAIIAAVLIAAVIYILLQIAFLGAINWTAGGYKVGDWLSLSSGPLSTSPLYSELKYTGIPLFGAFAVVLLIDAWVSPTNTGWITMGSGSRTIYGMGATGNFPQSFLNLTSRKVPFLGLLVMGILGFVFMLPFPSWYLLVGFMSATTLFTLLMGGVSVAALRKTAPMVHRPFKIPLVWVLAGAGTISAVLVAYWSGYSIVMEVCIFFFTALPLFIILHGAGFKGSVTRVPALVGTVLIIIIAVLQYFGYIWTVEGESALSSGLISVNTYLTRFAIYYLGTLLMTVLGLVYLYLGSKISSKKSVKATLWMICLVFFLLIISLFGAYGPIEKLPFPWDTIIVVAGTAVFYIWGGLSGWKTSELETALSVEASSREKDLDREGD